MKKTFTDLKTMLLRPAYYNGTQFETDLIFDGADMQREDLVVAKALNMPTGDTVRIRGCIRNKDERKLGEYLSVYMSGDVLDEFISRFGVEDISQTLTLKLELVYSLYESNDCSFETVEDEIIGFRLLEIC